VDQLLDALPQGEHRTGDQHEECRQQRPKVDLPPVSQGMLIVAITGTAVLSDDEDDPGGDIGE
jgi:hypothetical protein